MIINYFPGWADVAGKLLTTINEGISIPDDTALS